MKKFNRQILEAVERGLQRGLSLSINDFNLDDLEDNDQPIYQDGAIKKQVKNIGNTFYKINQNFIDMGLPSRTLWAKYNIGVDKDNLKSYKDWYGNFYAWGETEPKAQYSWKNYQYSKYDSKKAKQFKEKYFYTSAAPFMTKYCNNEDYGNCDNKITLDLNDDIAYINNPNKNYYEQQIPSANQCEELLLNSDVKYVTNYNNVKRLNGFVFTSKINGNSLFFPATGFFNKSSINRVLKQKYFIIPSSTINTRDCSLIMCLTGLYSDKMPNNIDVIVSRGQRYIGITVRAVLKNYY